VVGGNGNRIDGNQASGSGAAFTINGSNNVIMHNTARSGGINEFVINGSANSYGTIFDVHNGGAMTTNEPLCNLVY
jgi:parallel beta-helix repeat protein